MALSSLDPLGRSGGVLPSADPSALEVAMARNKQEDELAKGIQALNQKAAAEAAKLKSKEKLAAGKQLTELTKGTTFMPHTEASGKFYNDFIAREGKRWQDFDSGTGGDPMQPGTQAWIDRNRDLQAWEQMQASSKQIQDKYAAVSGHVLANKGDYASDTLERLQEDYANPQYLADGTFPDDPVAYIDLNKAVESRFGHIKPEVTAWATQDGTASGTFEQVQFNDLKAQAEEMAVANPDLTAKLGETYEGYTPEKKQQIQAMMAKHKISEPAAVALDLAVAKYGAGKETEISEQVSESGAGRSEKAASARELLETGFGIAGGSAEGRKVRDVVLADEGEITSFIEKYPKVLDKTRFDIGTDEVITNYNNLYYDTEVKADGKKIPAKVRGIVRDKNDGSVRVIYSTDDKGTDATVTEKIPKKEFYSKVIRRIALNTPEYDINTLDRIAQDEYKLIEGSGGQINLPERGKKSAYGTTPTGKKKAY